MEQLPAHHINKQTNSIQLHFWITILLSVTYLDLEHKHSKERVEYGSTWYTHVTRQRKLEQNWVLWATNSQPNPGHFFSSLIK